MTAREARRRRAAIARDRKAYEALLDKAIEAGDCKPDEVNYLNAGSRDKRESEATLARIEAESS